MEQHLMEKTSAILITTLLRNVMTFGVDHSSSSHTDNCRNNY